MMAKHDHQILFTALAFVAVVLKDGENIQDGNAQKINALAKLLGGFCMENVTYDYNNPGNGYVDDRFAARIDANIAQHIDELHKHDSTTLPNDREMLIQLYDRLLQRKTRREQWQLYATASKEQLAKLVLQYIAEETISQRWLS